MEKQATQRPSWKLILALQTAIMVYSLSGVLIKLAGQHPVLSAPFLLLYGASMFVIALYALVWQQILKRLPLSTAYSNSAVGVIWSIVWGALFFREPIGWNMILGALIIIAGLYLVVSDNG
ncbi:MAG: EamA family transporter [Clostridia bacterium]|nr:EamA family transporter [Clostridia bacterium]